MKRRTTVLSMGFALILTITTLTSSALAAPGRTGAQILNLGGDRPFSVRVNLISASHDNQRGMMTS